MSIRSKAKRDARRKQQSRAPQRIVVAPRPGVEAHADLRDEAGELLGGIARREGEWVLGLDGRIVGGSESPATLLAMLRRAATMQREAGREVRLKFSDALRTAADEEARAQGLSFEEFEAQLDHRLRTGDADATPLAH
ncbi:hypothetical protein N799_00020 [Lysobacter arseniciresistens ZS79]|uniref:Uncharacterized protein n=1 Tax=Lysobacter arseniciresistens ZS79 TaxID=913325 RepID=A0A0A0F531_9GAMM|nr:hypothetical protein [Lysobacter arseniciresistens]KGM57625.1 hypothetical protein N799_00020 [Lysobacter arseniciresistens ZS79]